MVMWAIVDLSEEMSVPSMLVEVVDNVCDKKEHDFLETLLVAHPLLVVGVPIRGVIKFPAVDHHKSVQRN